MKYIIYTRDSNGYINTEAIVTVEGGRVSWDRHSRVEELLPTLRMKCGKLFDPNYDWEHLPGILNGSRLWVQADNGEVVMKATITLKGGPGSGHHGHGGLSGVHGGSVPGKGSGKGKSKKIISKKPAKSKRAATVSKYTSKGFRVSSVDKKEGWTILQKGKHAVIVDKDGKVTWDSEALGAEALLPGIKWREAIKQAKEFISKYEDDKITIRLKGGAGSGHHGHRGRPGKKGGSLPGEGGDSTLGGTSTTGHKKPRMRKYGHSGLPGMHPSKKPKEESDPLPGVQEAWDKSVERDKILSTEANKRSNRRVRTRAYNISKFAVDYKLWDMNTAIKFIQQADEDTIDSWEENIRNMLGEKEDDMSKIKIRLKGGPGSGYHGHGGLDDVHGGSTPGKGGKSSKKPKGKRGGLGKIETAREQGERDKRLERESTTKMNEMAQEYSEKFADKAMMHLEVNTTPYDGTHRMTNTRNQDIIGALGDYGFVEFVGSTVVLTRLGAHVAGVEYTR